MDTAKGEGEAGAVPVVQVTILGVAEKTEKEEGEIMGRRKELMLPRAMFFAVAALTVFAAIVAYDMLAVGDGITSFDIDCSEDGSDYVFSGTFMTARDGVHRIQLMCDESNDYIDNLCEVTVPESSGYSSSHSWSASYDCDAFDSQMQCDRVWAQVYVVDEHLVYLGSRRHTLPTCGSVPPCAGLPSCDGDSPYYCCERCCGGDVWSCVWSDYDGTWRVQWRLWEDCNSNEECVCEEVDNCGTDITCRCRAKPTPTPTPTPSPTATATATATPPPNGEDSDDSLLYIGAGAVLLAIAYLAYRKKPPAGGKP